VTFPQLPLHTEEEVEGKMPLAMATSAAGLAAPYPLLVQRALADANLG
jgi:hypothetical protein